MFARARAASVKDQLAGRSEGRVLGKPRPGEPAKPEFWLEDILQPVLLKALDTNQDNKLSRKELVEGFDKWFLAWDVDKKGALTEEQLRKGLNQALPFPFLFGLPRGPDPKPPGGKQPARPE
jgi:hypothetical protein